MAKTNKRGGRIRLVFRRSRPLTKCVVLAMVLLCTAALLSVRIAVTEANAQTEALRARSAALEQKNDELTQRIAELGTVQSVVRIAQEELGLAFPDTIVFKPE